MKSSSILRTIDCLVDYGCVTGLIDKNEEVYSTNLLLDLLGIDSYDSNKENLTPKKIEEIKKNPKRLLHDTLEKLLAYAIHEKIIRDLGPCREIYATKLMNCITPRPSMVIDKFWNDYAVSPLLATSNFFEFSNNTNYINRYRLSSDLHWETPTPYGNLQILISLSKPELDPEAIAEACKHSSKGYPLCALCKENEGYAGRIDFAARQTHRIIPFSLEGERFGFQFSPYRYCNQHCIVFNDAHTPIVINESTIRKLFSFITLFPHFFIGSNSDLPYVGGSILSHEHFQGGLHRLPIMDAKPNSLISRKRNFEIDTLFWPLSTIRLKGKDKESIIRAAGEIIRKWKTYFDESQNIDAGTNENPHNTIMPLAYMEGDDFVLFLMLRNNKTTINRPEGIFHTRPAYFHIKKEGIGIIDAPGLAILPPRLKHELGEIKRCLLENQIPQELQCLQSHWEWIDELKKKYKSFTDKTIDAVLKKEVGIIFMKMLEDCGVFKQTEDGQNAFRRFIDKCMIF